VIKIEHNGQACLNSRKAAEFRYLLSEPKIMDSQPAACGVYSVGDSGGGGASARSYRGAVPARISAAQR